MENNNGPIMVSVCMTSYYHEPYIAQSIESVLSQKTDFNYEIVISDDCSKDRTQEIIREYAEKYPCIKYKFNEENIGLTKNVFQAKTMAEGKYVVPLSGDDYWIDDRKLQKQVEFLEKHPEYIGVATRIEMRQGDSTEADFLEPSENACGRTFRLKDFLGGINFPMNGFLMRNPLKENYDLFSLMPKLSPYIDDLTDCILTLKLGDIYILKDATVAYRRRIEETGKHNFNSLNKGLDKLKKQIELLNNLYLEFGREMDLFNRYKLALGPEIFKHYRKSTRNEFKNIFDSIPEEYRKRGIIFHSFLYIVPKTFEVVMRKFRR